jgi:ABC-type sugar transport system ATPase subunit
MIVTRKLSIQAGTFRLIDIDLEVGQGEYAVLMGRTGCGKTTILETICGLRNVSAGRIELRGRDVTDLKPAERDIGYVPQDLALFSTMTVREQLAFAPRIRAWPETEIEARVTELAELLGISALLDRHPTGLSGGEMQRVALGRALAARCGILCLDEPLSNLDWQTASSLCDLLKSVQSVTGVTTLHISHSISETERLADRIFILEDGLLREVSLDELKDR